MDTFRLVLILIGVAILVGIYVFETRRRKHDRPRHKEPFIEGKQEEGDESLDLDDLGGISAVRDGVVDVPGTDDALSAPRVVGGKPASAEKVDKPPVQSAQEPAPALTGFKGLRTDPSDAPVPASPPQPQASAQATEKEQAPDEAEAAEAVKPEPPSLPKGMQELIVAVHVMAPKGRLFEGAQLQAAVEEAGLQYGAMKIYHWPGGDGTPLFSLANVLEPGTFELDALKQLSTPGVVLFTRIPGLVKGREAFDRMLDIAAGLAETMHGEVRDERRNPLTKHNITLIREQIAEYEYKLEVARKRAGR